MPEFMLPVSIGAPFLANTNAMLCRWQFDALSVRQTRDYYALQDANYNVLGVVDAEGDLVERYDYTPYGERRVYNHHHIVLSDYDDDGDVDLDDFITCNQNFGLTDATHDQGDSNGDGAATQIL